MSFTVSTNSLSSAAVSESVAAVVAGLVLGLLLQAVRLKRNNANSRQRIGYGLVGMKVELFVSIACLHPKGFGVPLILQSWK